MSPKMSLRTREFRALGLSPLGHIRWQNAASMADDSGTLIIRMWSMVIRCLRLTFEKTVPIRYSFSKLEVGKRLNIEIKPVINNLPER